MTSIFRCGCCHARYRRIATVVLFSVSIVGTKWNVSCEMCVYVCVCLWVSVRKCYFLFFQKREQKTTQHDKTFEIRYLIHYTKSNYISNMTNVYRLGSCFFPSLWLHVWVLYSVYCAWWHLQYCFCCCPYVTKFARTKYYEKPKLFGDECANTRPYSL